MNRILFLLVLLLPVLAGCAGTVTPVAPSPIPSLPPLPVTPTVTLADATLPAVITATPTASAPAPSVATLTPPLPTVALPLATLTAPVLTFVPANIPACPLAPLVVPTRPSFIPENSELDKATGLHMTGKPSALDPATYRLRITGLVQRPLSLSLDELRCLPRLTEAPELVCPGVFLDIATWGGVQLKLLLDMAGIKPGAKSIRLIAADYQMAIPLADALKEDNFLAYEWKGQPLPILHGFPLRAVLPSMYGYNWVKWLVEIKVE
jgi:DMSO/TMAO reductase YedYZ molybdopterin-dependent catalytic subunit